MQRLLEIAHARQVDRWGAGYAVVAWLVVQAASIAFTAFHAPDALLQALIVVAVVGFPIVLLAAWFGGRRVTIYREGGRTIPARDWMLWIGVLAVVAVSAAQLFLSARSAAPGSAPPPAAMNDASIAVLPFVNMSGDPAKDYFSDGISEELLNDLANAPSLRVAARTSSFAFKNKQIPIDEIGRRLHVAAVLEGSVREDGTRIRITAQLINAQNGYHLWSQTYDRELVNVLSLQTEIAQAITRTLTSKLLGAPAGRPAAIAAENYRNFLKARRFFEQVTDEGNNNAIDLLTKVTSAQPDFAEAWALLGYAYIRRFDRLADVAGVPTLNPVDFTKAQEALAKALKLDPNNLTALRASMILSLNALDWRAATSFMARLQKLSPESSTTLGAETDYFGNLGFNALATAAAEKAVKIDPLSLDRRLNLAIRYLYSGNNLATIETANAALKMQAHYTPALALLCGAYGNLRSKEDLLRVQHELEQAPGGSRVTGCRRALAQLSGDVETARQLVDANPYLLFAALGRIGLGDYEVAAQYVNRDMQMNDYTPYSFLASKYFARVAQTPLGKSLMLQPHFKAWQAEHDRVAALLAAHRPLD